MLKVRCKRKAVLKAVLTTRGDGRRDGCCDGRPDVVLPVGGCPEL